LKNLVLRELRGRAGGRPLVTDGLVELTAVAPSLVGRVEAIEAFFNSPTVPD
jgi:hypothetical protein